MLMHIMYYKGEERIPACSMYILTADLAAGLVQKTCDKWDFYLKH